jgi:carbon monoxide dehydrogenase subunit G
MPKESFSRSVGVTASADEAWRTITDVATLVGWVSLLHEATTISVLDHYTAVLTDKLGPFSLKADLDIHVKEYDAPSFITVRAEGEDRQMRSRIVVEARVNLKQSEAGLALDVNGTYELSGRVATLGAAAIRTKAAKIQDEFFSSLTSALG